ncbi:MAG: cryptochrome/photolyase family protein [Gemmatimonadota bacterium]|nr:cryptochrome/photolyase family protein [Gemmatimonadota bacterium]
MSRPRSTFARLLADRQSDPAGRRWLYVPYDQLTAEMGPLSEEDPHEVGIVLVEAPAKAALRPYHRQKLALVLANQRHFALEQAARGVAVRYEIAEGTYADALTPLAQELGPLRVMEPAERELRADLASAVDAGALRVLPHDGWLTTREEFLAGAGASPPWRMDAFYRLVRRATGILMEDGKPVGGKYSFDSENRRPWRGEPPAPTPPTFTADAVTQEVASLIELRYRDHPGRLDLEHLPATAADADALWTWAMRECLPAFGPYEDAMSTRSRGLFHTRIAALLNLHRLTPRRVVTDALALDLPLASQEGFIRQILGWREFVRHVHRETDGFRRTEGSRDGLAGAKPDLTAGDAAPSMLHANWPLPPAFWGAPAGFACLDTVVREVWDDAYGHHITRLMVLANIATLLGVSPRELTDWFWVAYADAYDWVVEPNVLGMGTYAAGDVMTTKPYVSGAAYINRMSDYCLACAFDPKGTCPLSDLYWQFLARNRDRLAGNPRVALPLRSLARRSSARSARDARVLEVVRARLSSGRPVTPADLPPVSRRD